MLAVALVAVCIAGGLTARHNLRQGRGDRRGAFRLAFFVFCLQMALWLTTGHFTVSGGTFGAFVLALCTSTFYGVFLWTVYLALEPAVRRRWPQTLISWSALLIGKLRDPVVGRDVLVGALFGMATSLIGWSLDSWFRHTGHWSPNMHNTDLLLGTRAAFGYLLAVASRAIRDAVFFYFLIFLLRLLLRREWFAGAAFALMFGLLNGYGEHGVANGIGSVVILLGFAYTLLRWGLVTMAVCNFFSHSLANVPVTIHGSAWYFSNTVLVIACVLALLVWAFRTAIGGRPARA